MIAWHLKQLRNAGVPVLWRPYHEMNGDWFWWGKKPGDDGYKKLWRMLYDRLVNFHGLNNLIWVYNCNETRANVDPYTEYFPGHDVVDVLATDVYSTGFAKEQYDELLALAGDKPIAWAKSARSPRRRFSKLSRAGRGSWPGASRAAASASSANYRVLYASEEALTHDELPWVTVKDPKIHYPVLK